MPMNTRLGLALNVSGMVLICSCATAKQMTPRACIVCRNQQLQHAPVLFWIMQHQMVKSTHECVPPRECTQHEYIEQPRLQNIAGNRVVQKIIKCWLGGNVFHREHEGTRKKTWMKTVKRMPPQKRVILHKPRRTTCPEHVLDHAWSWYIISWMSAKFCANAKNYMQNMITCHNPICRARPGLELYNAPSCVDCAEVYFLLAKKNAQNMNGFQGPTHT